MSWSRCTTLPASSSSHIACSTHRDQQHYVCCENSSWRIARRTGGVSAAGGAADSAAADVDFGRLYFSSSRASWVRGSGRATGTSGPSGRSSCLATIIGRRTRPAGRDDRVAQPSALTSDVDDVAVTAACPTAPRQTSGSSFTSFICSENDNNHQ